RRCRHPDQRRRLLLRPAQADRGGTAREGIYRDQVELNAPVRWRLACFDLDGTLVQGTSVSQFLADQLGQSEPMAELERLYAAGEISNSVVADEQASAYAGIPLEEIVTQLADIPCIQGIDETLKALGEEGIVSLLCTVTWSFAAREFVRRHGFAAASG